MVVDNGSVDGSAEIVAKEFSRVKLIKSAINLGYAKANNLAIKCVKDARYVWLLNSDTEVGRNVLQQSFDFLEANSAVAAIEPQLVYPSGAWQSVGGFFPTPINVLAYLVPLINFFPRQWRVKCKLIGLYPQEIKQEGKDLDYVTGAALFLRRSALEQVGVLNENYFMYFEEVDLCWRLRSAGWKIMAIKSDPVVHIYGGSFKTQYAARRLKLFLDSMTLFVRNNYTGFKKMAILAEIRILGSISLFFKGLKS